jgi:hypothetical protein
LSKEYDLDLVLCVAAHRQSLVGTVQRVRS